MSTREATFGDVRAIAQSEPSAGRWFELCAMLEAWPRAHELDEAVVPYLSAHMSRWPDDLMVVPDRWVDDYLSGALGELATLPKKLFLVSRFKQAGLFRRLLDASAIGSLTQLFIGWNGLGPEHLARLSGCDALGGLTHLSLLGNRIGGLRPLVEGAWRDDLVWLDLAHSDMGPRDLKILFDEGVFARLRHLDVSHNPLQSLGSLRADASPLMSRLEVLSVGGSELGNEGAARLIGGASGGALRALDLSYNLLTDETARLLVRSGVLRGLKTLDLNSNTIGDEGIAAIVSSPDCAGLERLRVQRNAFGVDGVRAIASSPFLGSLTELRVSGSSPEVHATLAESSTLPRNVRAMFR